MAFNLTTGIDPDVDTFALYDEGQSPIVQLNGNTTWPRADGDPIVGGNPNYKYYKRVPGTAPVVDHRFTIATTWTRTPTDPAPPEGHPAGTYVESFAATKRPVSELKAQVETEFQRQVQIMFPSQNDPAVLVETAKALKDKVENATLSTEQQATLTGIDATGTGIAGLRARKAALETAIDNDEDYDITDGWTS